MMKVRVSAENNTLYWRLKGEILKLQPWGADGVRVRATNLLDFPDMPGALIDTLPDPPVAVTVEDGQGVLINGKLRAEIWADGTLHFFNAATGDCAAARTGTDLQ